MDIDKIISSFQYENENSQADLKRWLLRVDSMFGEDDITVALKDKKRLCQMFYLQKNSGVSRQSYHKIKTYIETLQNFFGIKSTIPSREDVLAARELTCLYKDLTSLIKFIDDVGNSKFEEYNPTEDLLNVKAIAILGWYGFSLEHAASMKKSSLHRIDGHHFINETEIDAEFYNVLTNLSYSTEFRGFPGGKLQIYRSDNNYLFRSIKADQIIVETHLVNLLQRFNREAATTGCAIVFRHLRKNALFVELDKDITNVKISEKIKSTFNCDIKTAYGIEKEYTQWKNNL